MKISTSLGNVTNAGGHEQDWGYLVPMDGLVGRYDNVKALKPLRKGQNTRERGKRGGSVRVGDHCLSDLGQWSQFLPSVEGDQPRYRPNLQTQKEVLMEKSNHKKIWKPRG